MSDFTGKITTGKGVLVNPHLLRVNSRNKFENATPKYGTTFVISKDDTETLSKIELAIKFAIEQGKFTNDAQINMPLKDGDSTYPGEILYENAMFLYASTTFKPKVVDHKLTEINFRVDEFQSGTYAKLSLEFVPYHFNGKCGVSARLINVQIFPQNKLLEIMSKPEDDFVVEDVE